MINDLSAVLDLISKGQDHKAIKILTAIILKNNKNTEALYLRGSLNLKLKHIEAAGQDLTNALNYGLINYQVLYAFGLYYLETRDHGRAKEIFNQAIHCAPNRHVLRLKVARVFHSYNLADEALELLDALIIEQANNVDALYNRGVIYLEKRQYECALDDFKKVYLLQPNNMNGKKNLAQTLLALEDYQASIKISQEILTKSIGDMDSLTNIAKCFFLSNNFIKAKITCEAILKTNPDNVNSHIILGHINRMSKRYDQASYHYRKALDLGCDDSYIEGDLFFINLSMCFWDNYEKDLNNLLDKTKKNTLVVNPFTLICAHDDPSLHLSVSINYARNNFTASNDEETKIFSISNKKIKIGYFSSDFYNHATMHLIAGLLEMHDRTKFEVYAFSFGPQIQDEMRRRAEAGVDKFFDVSSLSDREIAKKSKNLGIDIAIDLKGYTTHARPGIFSNRAAPIQVNYLGFPGTMGTKFIDYILADANIIPSTSDIYYSEKVIRIDGCYQINDDRRKAPAPSINRIDIDLPLDTFVFCCFNSCYKITPAIFQIWCNLLKETPDSVLWLLDDNVFAKNNILKEAERYGLHKGRIIFAPRTTPEKHLERIVAADLFLDCYPCGAHTTASDTLFAGVPLLTIEGNSFPSRVAASLLRSLKLEELIAVSLDDYQLIAKDLVQNKNKLTEIKFRLSKAIRESDLFNTSTKTKALEEALVKILMEN